MLFSSRSLLTVFVLNALSSLQIDAQERQGNIVEYFGKEKVTELREGSVLHVFSEGLVLPGSRFPLNSDTVPMDPVVSGVLLDETFEITEGKEEGVDRQGNARKWEAASTDDKNEFNDRRLRSGFLHLEYDSAEERTVLFEASGHTRVFINGFPHEGDHYDYGWSLIPVRLVQGTNRLLMTGGRFPRMRARLLTPGHPVQFTTRDMTLPDVLKEEKEDLLGAVRVINTSEEWFENGRIICDLSGQRRITSIAPVSPLNTRKIPFKIAIPEYVEGNQVVATISLQAENGATLSSKEIRLNVRSRYKHHKRTFVSDIDGSVQYYSIAPSSERELDNPAMFLSVHGASVEAVNQAAAYKQKKWGHLVAPTNRRAFGFAWEDWGRLDALEVLDHAERLLNTDRSRTYLTGHSMGGHGTWHLGATYPDRFAAIGPAAGYPDLLEYRNSFRRRLRTATDEDLQRFGMTRERANQMLDQGGYTDPVDREMDAMIRRGGNPSRTLKLKRNYLQHGVYVLHGENDTVVPTFLAREMREVLAGFHSDFAYYEYPGGTHWYGDHSVDWQPLFDFFQFRQIKAPEKIDKFEFYTASPGVSASSHFLTILQQVEPFEVSSVQFQRGDVPSIMTTNVGALSIDVKSMGDVRSIQLDEQSFELTGKDKAVFKHTDGKWMTIETMSKWEKGPHRGGGFKDAFKKHFILVYGTQGSETENAWYYNRARHDAETFWYRANGNMEIVRDTKFEPEVYPDRNVILYGNADNNAAWKNLLADCPIQVSDNQIRFGEKRVSGDGLGACFIYPRPDSDWASVGVVTATGVPGMKAAHANLYLQNGTTFPDVLILDQTVLSEGIKGVRCSGFFGNDWSVTKGDFVWR